jgi:hypothetical protein
MKIGIENTDTRIFHLEEEDGDVILADNEGFYILGLSVNDDGKICVCTYNDLDCDVYSLRKGHADIEVIRE